MSDLMFERGLFATMAAALVVPELATFLILVLVLISLAAHLTRQIWIILNRRPHLATVPIALRIVSSSTPDADRTGLL